MLGHELPRRTQQKRPSQKAYPGPYQDHQTLPVTKPFQRRPEGSPPVPASQQSVRTGTVSANDRGTVGVQRSWAIRSHRVLEGHRRVIPSHGLSGLEDPSKAGNFSWGTQGVGKPSAARKLTTSSLQGYHGRAIVNRRRLGKERGRGEGQFLRQSIRRVGASPDATANVGLCAPPYHSRRQQLAGSLSALFPMGDYEGGGGPGGLAQSAFESISRAVRPVC